MAPFVFFNSMYELGIITWKHFGYIPNLLTFDISLIIPSLKMKKAKCKCGCILFLLKKNLV